jgi:hypothetical protein
VDGWTDLVETFRSRGLPVPPVPASLRPALKRRGPWCWATSDGVTGLGMYSWSMEEVEAVLTGQGARHSYLAVSHAGHGINSYAVTYHLVYLGLAVFLQDGWGGIYMDNDAQAASLADMFRRCQALIERWDTQPQPPGRGLLCIESRLRGTAACGWVAADGRPLQRFLREHQVGSGEALAHAEGLIAP